MKKLLQAAAPARQLASGTRRSARVASAVRIVVVRCAHRSADIAQAPAASAEEEPPGLRPLG